MTTDFDLLSAALADRYRIERELGAGGMATVYLSQDLKHHRRVAIKVLKPELATTLGPERFVREIAIAANLNHPHILPLFDSGEAEGFLYYVMPYVEGETLRERLDGEGKLPVEEAVRLAVDVAAALSYAHAQGIVHRDIKPENIMLAGGPAVVADFGIARALAAAGDERLTGTGVPIGTPAYMSPEQATGERELDARSDLYSLGCVLYEMLTGRLPVYWARAGGARELRSKLKTMRRQVPSQLARVVSRCLEPEVPSRYRSASELLDDLDAIEALLATRRVRLDVLLRRRGLVAGIIGVALAIAAAGGWLWVRQSRAQWARTVALPEAAQLIEQGRNYAAFRLLQRAERHVPGDPVLQELLLESTMLVTVRTTPPGAQVYVRDFFDEPDQWDFLGRAPIEDVRLPSPYLVWKVSEQGYQTKERIAPVTLRRVGFSLQPLSETPPGMVDVEGRWFEVFTRSVELEPYWIDRYEVTNREFKEFIDRGGYERPESWTQPFVQDGVELSWEEARRLFRDRTGRPGPATWELGAYPDGLDEYPVGGVSWYEAAAFCRAVDKDLPTVFHWYNAAGFAMTTQFAAFSHFSTSGPAPVGHPLTMGMFGTYDMAGNVKEWTWNEADERRKYILGGGWSEPSYMFNEHDAQRPFDRQATHGFRCAKYPAPLSTALLAPLDAPFRDYRFETPIHAEAFAIYEGLYRYDPMPLEPRVESVEDALEHWRIERVSFAAAYGNERVPALLFLPQNARPPYQTVIYYPGGGAFFERPPFDVAEIEASWFLFLVRSGRAVLYPAYKGSYERRLGNVALPHVWRDVMIHSAKDLQRAVDYLETRPDIDADRLAYFGLSQGASVGPIMTAIEPRFKASVLLGGGLYFWRRLPESEPFNFLPRVKVPTLMINGRHDFFFQHEISQSLMFQWLGTPDKDKKHRIFDSGHIPSEQQEVMKEILDWLDRYLGPLGRVPVSGGAR